MSNKLDGKLIYELEAEARDEVPCSDGSRQYNANANIPFKIQTEHTQETYNRLAKKLGDYLIYGKKPEQK